MIDTSIGRNDGLFKYGCSQRAKGATNEEIRNELHQQNQMFSDPLNEKEVETIINSVCERYPMGYSNLSFRSKPNGVDYPQIRASIEDKAMSLDDIKTAILSGHSLHPAAGQYYQDKNGNKIFIAKSQQLIFFDFDNKENSLSSQEIIKYYSHRKTRPFLIYPTFSNSEECEKFRVCFCLNKPFNIEQEGKAALNKLKDKLIGKFKKFIDTNADYDVNRLYAGTNQKEIYFDNKNIVDIDNIDTEKDSIIKPIKSYLDDFIQEQDSEKPLYSTGFKNLDRYLFGGLQNELYMILAKTGVGKTTFCLNIAQNIAAQRKPVLYFGLEMLRKEFIAKGLSRITYELEGQTAYTTGEILYRKFDQGEYSTLKTSNYTRALEEYKLRYGENLYIFDIEQYSTIKEIESCINDFTDETGKNPVIFIDYLQYIRSDDPKQEERQRLDEAVRMLKIQAKNKPVICISSLNREGSKENDFDLHHAKGSGEIEYTCSNAFRLSKQEDILTLKNLKARHSEQGKQCLFKADLKYNVLSEIDEPTTRNRRNSERAI